MTLGRPPGAGSGRNAHGSVLENPTVLVSVPWQFSSTVVVTEKLGCAEALPHQAMNKASAPAAVARIPFSYQRMMFIASPSARNCPLAARKHTSSHSHELT